jgi:hypothetical protein
VPLNVIKRLAIIWINFKKRHFMDKFIKHMLYALQIKHEKAYALCPTDKA